MASTRGRIAERDDSGPAAPQDLGLEDEIDRPSRLAPPRDMGVPKFDRRGDEQLREPVDQAERSEARRRQERAIRQRRLAAQDNPFLNDEASVNIPPLPMDDPDWSYKWMRVKLPPTSADPAGVDASNIADNLHGRLGYEYVRLTDLPKRHQGLLSQFAKVEGKEAGYLTYMDCVAVRTSRKLRDLKVAAMDYRATELREQVLADQEEKADRYGYILNVNQSERRVDVDTGEDEQGAGDEEE